MSLPTTISAQTQPQVLDGKVALVSGSSSGIGAAIARELSARGATVIINYPFPSEKDAAQAVLDSLPKSRSSRRESVIVEADLSTIEGPGKLATTAATFGTIDFLINNAGRSITCDLAATPDDDLQKAWADMVNLNGRGTLLLTRAVLPILSGVGSRIVNIGSSTSRDPDADMSIYAGTKGMVESFTRCWARDFARNYGCTVNTVAPGPVATETLLTAPPSLLQQLQAKWDSVPVAPRFARLEELAWVVAELCDERASWLNGLYIPVTGGYTLN